MHVCSRIRMLLRADNFQILLARPCICVSSRRIMSYTSLPWLVHEKSYITVYALVCMRENNKLRSPQMQFPIDMWCKHRSRHCRSTSGANPLIDFGLICACKGEVPTTRHTWTFASKLSTPSWVAFHTCKYYLSKIVGGMSTRPVNYCWCVYGKLEDSCSCTCSQNHLQLITTEFQQDTLKPK